MSWALQEVAPGPEPSALPRLAAPRVKGAQGARDLAGWASQPRLQPPSRLQRRLRETAVPAIPAQAIVPCAVPPLKPLPQPHWTRLQRRPLPPLQSKLVVPVRLPGTAPNSTQPLTNFTNRKDSTC